jgi:hypothetical protein
VAFFLLLSQLSYRSLRFWPDLNRRPKDYRRNPQLRHTKTKAGNKQLKVGLLAEVTLAFATANSKAGTNSSREVSPIEVPATYATPKPKQGKSSTDLRYRNRTGQRPAHPKKYLLTTPLQNH